MRMLMTKKQRLASFLRLFDDCLNSPELTLDNVEQLESLLLRAVPLISDSTYNEFSAKLLAAREKLDTIA